jgi:hypothetical protein
MVTPDTSTAKKRPMSLLWCIGMFQASIFSMIYFIAPFYMLTSMFSLFFYYPSKQFAWIYTAPIFLSALVRPISAPWILKLLSPMLSYFDYEEIHESDVKKELLKGTNYICVCQPHGALSFVGICSSIFAPPEFQGTLVTAVADAVLYTPILKHVLGIFGLCSASKASMKKVLKKPGVEGTVVLYVGGMAELFLSCENEEKLYLKNRKGFIKLALQEGVDVIPIYMFGNTSVLSVLKTPTLSYISRKFGVSLTYIWGRWYLPLPRDRKILYVSGKPLGMPQIQNPTQQDLDKWHAKYCQEVTRIFEKYKEKVPEYKHKKLE